MSTGVVSMAVLMRMVVPLVKEFSVSRAPVMWSSFVSWLKPPYLYLIINGIIITIVASSRFFHHDDEDAPSDNLKTDFAGARSRESEYEYQAKLRSDFSGAVVYVEEKRREVEDEDDEVKEEYVKEVAPVAEEKSVVDVQEATICTPPRRMDSSEMLPEYELTPEKPLVSSRFAHRKPIRASPEGKQS